MPARCARCGRFLADPAEVIPIPDSIHPYTCDYDYLCGNCTQPNDL